MTPGSVDLAASYRAAEVVARKRARNFYYSFVVLPPEKRHALCAIYAFMRYCDDISDGAASVESKRALLRDWRFALEGCLRGEYRGNAILPAFHDAVQRFSIPPEYFHWLIDGAEMDLRIEDYSSFDDLYRYCFNVASSVGLVCIQVFGFSDPEARTLAEHLGVAFQLTNILRDVKEDATMGRIYLPREDLDKFDYCAEELHRGVIDDRFRSLMRFEAERAENYYRAGSKLLPLIEAASRPALWAMMEIYSRILRKIVRVEYDVFRDSIYLSGPEKISIALRALAMRFIPGGMGAR